MLYLIAEVWQNIKEHEKKTLKKKLSGRQRQRLLLFSLPLSQSLAGTISLLWLPLADGGQPNYTKQNALGISLLNCFDDKLLLRIVVNSSESRCSFLCLLGTDHHNFFPGNKTLMKDNHRAMYPYRHPKGRMFVSLSLCEALQKHKVSWDTHHATCTCWSASQFIGL